MRSPSRLLLIVLVTILTSACSSDDIKNEPMDLVDIEPEIQLKTLWTESIGDGTDDHYLSFTPYIQADKIYAAAVGGEIEALTLASGDEVWERETDDRISGGLGGDSSSLYYATFNGEVVALDISNGQERWRQNLSSEALSAPQSDGTTVIVNTIDGMVFAFDVATGERSWQFASTPPVLSVRGDAQVNWSDDLLVAGFADGHIRAFEKADGRPVWQYDAGLKKGRTELERLVDIDGKPLIENGVVYGIAYQGKVAALDLVSGREHWSKAGSSYRGLGQGFNHLYLSTDEDTVAALSKNDGVEIWKNESLKYRSLTSPQTLEEFLVVGDYEGYLHFLSQIDGHAVAREHLDCDGIRSPLLVKDNILYVYTNSGDLTALKIAR